MTLLILFIILSHITAFIVLITLSWRFARNLHFLSWTDKHKTNSGSRPLVSVLIPARNEAANITACITSLLDQSYPNTEIIVLNDQSSDETGRLLDNLTTNNQNLHVIHSNNPPPVGWNGKSFACHRLSEQANGEWLLFTDADTIHFRNSVSYAVAQANALQTDLLSAIPRQQTVTWSEKLLIPFIIGFLPLVAWDLTGIWQGQSNQIIANGQFLFINANIYYAIGGHKSVKGALVDDFALAHHFHDRGYRIALIDGADMVICRMYRNRSEVWHGFSKNIFLSLSESNRNLTWWRQLTFSWCYASVFVTPYILLLLPMTPISLLWIAWMWLLYATVAFRLNRSVFESPLVSISAMGVMVLSMNALFRRWRSKAFTWKGRTYP